MNESSATVLNLTGLYRSYKTDVQTIEVLKGVDLAVHRGEMVGLIGPSGSGKSSLLHAAGLLEAPTSGTVTIADRDASNLSDFQRTWLRRTAIGFVYQFHHLMPEFTALENVALPAMISGQTREAASDRAARLLKAMGLAERMDHQPGQLSGGEQQRVAIARAMANGPCLLLADEPTGNLDPQTAHNVFKTLQAIVRSSGVGALIATHNLELTRFMDRVVSLKDGNLQDVTGKP
jgi:lipoprotein-releasing system ATP-binding protein